MNIKSLKVLAIPLVGFALSAQANTTSTRSTNSNTYDTASGADTASDSTGMGDSSTSPRTLSTTGAKTGSNNPSVLDQSLGSPQDVEVTRAIREELNKSDTLSTSAKNVEVITLNNTVTLRGAVASQAERTDLVTRAQRAAGNRSIKNEITVDTTKR